MLKLLQSFTIVFICIGVNIPLYAVSQNRSGYYTSPDAVSSLLEAQNRKRKAGQLWSMEAYEAWKKSLENDYGLSIGSDYHLTGFAATDALGKKESLGSVFRVFGEWKLTGKETPNSGSLVFKGEYRHAVNGISPVDFASELGYAGLVQSTYSDQKWRMTTLYWKQHLFDGDMTVYAGLIDVTEYTDIYLLISPWNGFGNMVFATGSATIGGLPDASLGVMAAGWLSDTMYIVGSITDANADASDPFNGFHTLFDDFETFKTLELGWTTGKEQLFFDNFHITLWQMDDRPKAGTKEGGGISFSLTHTLDKNWLTFLRGGYSKNGGALLKRSLSTGFGYKVPQRDDVVGVGLNWGRPNDELYGDVDDQWTSELFYRYQAGKRVQITPSLQLIAHPALNPNTDFITLFGLRAEISF